MAVSERKPAKKLGHLAVFLRPEDHVPVIGHDAVAEDAHGDAVEGFEEGALEGFVVVGFGEDARAGVGAIEDVIKMVGGGNAWGAWHRENGARGNKKLQAKRYLTPFLSALRVASA